nr:hypothetical protein [Clostridia bacterium]
MELVVTIILFIIGIIFKLLEKMGDSKQGTGSGVSGRPAMSGNLNNPGHLKGYGKVYRQSGNGEIHMSSAEKGGAISAAQGSASGGYASQGEGFSLESMGGSTLEGKGLEGLKDTPYDNKVKAVQLEIIPSGTRRHALSFSRHDIINGIIMSELLHPPKALRRRMRY